MSEEKNIFVEILNRNYPERRLIEANKSGHQLLIDKIHEGYTFTGFVSNQQLENRGVKHYLFALNNQGQYKWIERDFTLGIKDALWTVIDGYSGIKGPKEEQFDNLLETVLTLGDQKYYINNIESYYDDIHINNQELMVGLAGIYKLGQIKLEQKPHIQIIPLINPINFTEINWLTTTRNESNKSKE